jgi:hypothetical protein
METFLVTLGALEHALLAFPGCALIVSHDRWFLDRVVSSCLAGLRSVSGGVGLIARVVALEEGHVALAAGQLVEREDPSPSGNLCTPCTSSASRRPRGYARDRVLQCRRDHRQLVTHGHRVREHVAAELARGPRRHGRREEELGRRACALTTSSRAPARRPAPPARE